MSDFVNMLVNLQINAFASSTTAAIIFVTVFDCLLVYACTFPARRKVSQAEFGIVIVAIILVILVVLDFAGGS